MEENMARIRRQNSRKNSEIIGNPPYNANQFIAESAAQKTKAPEGLGH